MKISPLPPTSTFLLQPARCQPGAAASAELPEQTTSSKPGGHSRFRVQSAVSALSANSLASKTQTTEMLDTHKTWVRTITLDHTQTAALISDCCAQVTHAQSSPRRSSRASDPSQKQRCPQGKPQRTSNDALLAQENGREPATMELTMKNDERPLESRRAPEFAGAFVARAAYSL